MLDVAPSSVVTTPDFIRVDFAPGATYQLFNQALSTIAQGFLSLPPGAPGSAPVNFNLPSFPKACAIRVKHIFNSTALIHNSIGGTYPEVMVNMKNKAVLIGGAVQNMEFDGQPLGAQFVYEIPDAVYQWIPAKTLSKITIPGNVFLVTSWNWADFQPTADFQPDLLNNLHSIYGSYYPQVDIFLRPCAEMLK